MAAFLFRGLAGVIGGVLIWRGKKMGYHLTAVAWLYLVTVGLIALAQIHGNPAVVPSFELTPENSALYLKPLAQAIGKIIWGVLILYVLFKELLSSSQRHLNQDN